MPTHCRAMDGYSGFNDLYRSGVREVACMAHIRKFVDVA